jgi:uncharacterized protein with GYD domain
MILAKYSSAGAKAVLAEGFVSRQQAAEKLMEAAGGRVIAYYAITDADWDVVNISEWPDSWGDGEVARAATFLTSSGAYEKIRSFRLAAPQTYDSAARTAEQNFRPAGTS